MKPTHKTVQKATPTRRKKEKTPTNRHLENEVELRKYDPKHQPRGATNLRIVQEALRDAYECVV